MYNGRAHLYCRTEKRKMNALASIISEYTLQMYSPESQFILMISSIYIK